MNKMVETSVTQKSFNSLLAKYASLKKTEKWFRVITSVGNTSGKIYGADINFQLGFNK